jgi:2-haloacid dehalogenase
MHKDRSMMLGRRPFMIGMGLAAIGVFSKGTGSEARAATDRPGGPPSVLVFDVMETLLDIGAISPFFQRVFGDAAVARDWFGETILYSETATVTKGFTPFGELAGGILRMLGRIHGIEVKPADVEELRALLSELPPYPDVRGGLKLLRDGGFKLVTLTDSAVPEAHAGALAKAGLDRFFDAQFSAESVRQYKPARSTYQMVSDQLKVSTNEMCMIAAHPWDLIGAQSAGCMGALITRPGIARLMLKEIKEPDVTAPTLTGVAELLLASRRA